ncbi:MAG: class I SAM-dependent rRNA methyltransferase [Deinococcales bacterium]
MQLQAALQNPKRLQQLLQTALTKRQPLEESVQTNAYRVFNALGDGIEALTIDRFASVLVLSLYSKLEPQLEQTLLECVAEVYQPESIYVKRRPKEARIVANTERDLLAPEAAAWGVDTPELTVLESGRRFVIRAGGDLSVGIFLDMRLTRDWLQENIGSSRVLNCFSYTCGFGVAAALGGATRVVNLDLSRRVLDWGQENYKKNRLVPRDMDFIAGDTFDWFKRLTRREDKFDAVILDPPSFATSKHSRFSAASNYDDLVAQAVRLLEPHGLLLACCNHAKLSRLQFKKDLARGLERAGRGYNLIKSLRQSSLDFPVPTTAEAPLKVFALEVI